MSYALIHLPLALLLFHWSSAFYDQHVLSSKYITLDIRKICQLFASSPFPPSKSASTLSKLASNICSHLALSSITTCVSASSPHIQTSLLFLHLIFPHPTPPSTITSRTILPSSSKHLESKKTYQPPVPSFEPRHAPKYNLRRIQDNPPSKMSGKQTMTWNGKSASLSLTPFK